MSKFAKRQNYSDGFDTAAYRMTVPEGASVSISHLRFRGGYSRKKQLPSTHVVAFGFLLITTLVPVCLAAQSENPNDQEEVRHEHDHDKHERFVAPTVFQAAGPKAAQGATSSIQSTVDAFRAALGNPNNGNNPSTLLATPPAGRREINWDGGGSTDTTPPVTPFNVFLNTRGGQFTTPGEGLSQAPPSGGAQGGLAVLFNNPTYATIFSTFSSPRLFTPKGSNVTEALFFIPGSNGATPATVRGFGAVFTDVDQPDGSGPGKKRGNRGASTLIEYFGVDKKVLFSSFVPASPGDASLSFFGIVFDQPLIARVRITTGDKAPGPDDGKDDIVVMDDFIYGEPVRAQEGAKDFLSIDETARTEAAAPGTHSLKVNNGRGSGRHVAGKVVTVTADAPPAGQEFAGWSGDIQILANPFLSTTTATMPSIDVTVSATYADASSGESSE
jgi:hypothetical protein